MTLASVHLEKLFVLFTFLQVWIRSSHGMLVPGGDIDFNLRLQKNGIKAMAGCAQIPCAYTSPMRIYSAQRIWFRGSPEFPLSPPVLEEKKKLMWPLTSIENECSIILWDFSGHERVEEYGLMLKWGTNEKHVYDERVTVSYSTVHLNISHSEVLIAGKQSLITCSLPDLCLGNFPIVTWKGLNSKQRFFVGNPRNMKNYLAYSEELYYRPMPEDHQAEITCEATFGKNLSASATVTLTVHSPPEILNSSSCSLTHNLLSCVCVIQAVPSPDVHWPLLQDNTDFKSVTTSDGHITVKSSFTMTVKDFTSISPPVCVSTNELGRTNMTLTVNLSDVKEDA